MTAEATRREYDLAERLLVEPPAKLEDILAETDELIAIFVTSIRTAQNSEKGGKGQSTD